MNGDYSPSNPLVPPDEVASWIDAVQEPVAVTGGTGFVGSHLVDALCAAGVQPRVLARNAGKARWIADSGAQLIEASLEDRDSLERLVRGAGTVLHLAGVLRAGREADFDRGNRVGTANLVGAVRRMAPGARFVHVSSLAAMGPSPDPKGIAPGDPPAPISAYGRSKLAGEAEVAKLGDRIDWCILRPPAVYGPRDTDVLQFFKMASRGVAAVPSGERWLTTAFVADVVRAVVAAAADGETGGAYHLGEPVPQRLDRMLRTLAEAGGCRVRIVPVPAPVVIAAGAAGSGLQRLGWRRLPLTVDKARELLGKHWTADTASSLAALGVGAGTPFKDGARETWLWYRMKGWLR